MTDPTPISLVFSPDFPSSPHKDLGTNIISIESDPTLAGRLKVFHPEGKHRLEIGRHSDCWVCIGAGAYDSVGASKFDTISRVVLTIVWSQNLWNEPKWLIMTGGVFVDATTGELVPITNPPIGVWLNGQKLQPQDTSPLFAPGLDYAKVSIGELGRIVIMDRVLDAPITRWPDSAWEGGSENGWPDSSNHNLIEITQKRADIEQAIYNSKIKAATATTTEKTWPEVAGHIWDGIWNGPKAIPDSLWKLFVIGITSAFIWEWIQHR